MFKTITKMSSITSLLAASIIPAQYVSAQESMDQKKTVIEEIIVNARKTQENSQDIPLAVTVLDEAALQVRNVKEPFDLQYLTPSLNISIGAAGSVNLRGQGQSALGSGPAVVGYMDEVPMSTQASLASVGIFDLKNVQIVKGPQGTLFGRNTTGGAILYTSNRPTEEFEGYAKLTGGDYGLLELEGAINIPVSDSLAIRLSGQTRDRDGYVKNVITGKEQADIDQEAYRLGVQWQVTDNIENLLTTNYLKSHANGVPFILSDVRANPTSAVHLFYGATFDQHLANQQALGIRKVASTTRDEASSENTMVTDVLTWQINDSFTLKNIASYAKNKLPYTTADYDYTPSRAIDFESHGAYTESRTNELQLQGDLFDSKLKFVAGLYYEDVEEERKQYTYQFMDAFYPNIPALFGPLAGAPAATTTYQPTLTTQESKAVFGQLTYDLSNMLEGLSVTAGARRTWDERETEREPFTSSVLTGFNLVCDPTPAAGQPCLYKADGDWAENTWTLGLDYRINDDAMVYVVSRQGYKAGGFNAYAPSLDELTFDPEYVTDYEVGAKLDWTLGSMPGRTNIAIYRSEFDDIQRTDSYLDGTSFKSYITNLAEATIDGVELELTLLPTDNLRLDFMYSYTDAGYDDYTDGFGVDRSDQPFTNTPENRVNVRVSYTVPMDADLGSLNVSADYSWQDEWLTNPSDELSIEETTVDSYSLVNARLQWSNAMNSGFDVGLFGTNLADEDYVAGVVGAGATIGFTTYNYGPPRMWGVDVRYDFN